MTYIKPQVLVYQEFNASPVSQDTSLRAWIVGPNAVAHEKGTEEIGDYADMRSTASTVPVPGLSAGSEVEEGSVHVYAKDARLQYALVNAPSSDLTSESVYAAMKPGEPNILQFTNLNIRTNGTYTRDARFGNHDVEIGDVIRISGCGSDAFETEVLDFAVNVSDGTFGKPARLTNKTTYSTSATAIPAGTPAGGTLTGTYTGDFADEYYTLNAVSVDGTVTYSVTSASGTDNFPVNATPAAEGGQRIFSIGRHGITYTSDGCPDTPVLISVKGTMANGASPARTMADIYDGPDVLDFTGNYSPIQNGSISDTYLIQVTECSHTLNCRSLQLRITSVYGDDSYDVEATESGSGFSFPLSPTADVTVGIEMGDFASVNLGDSWAYTFKSSYTPPTLDVSGTYTGEEPDYYIVTCVAGGAVNSEAKVTIRSTRGSEFIGPVTASSTGIETAYGLTIEFDGEESLLLGEAWQIQAIPGANGAVRAVILRDSVPHELRNYSASTPLTLDVSFCAKRDIEMPGVTCANKQVTIPANARVTLPEFRLNNGNAINMAILSGKLSVACTELTAFGKGKLNYISNSIELADIPGPMAPSNPLKYGLYKALANANGTTLVYTNTQGNTLEDWQEAFNAGVGSREVYSLVPLTQDLQVLNLAAAVVQQDSNEETCAWKNCFLNTTAPASVMRVGQSSGTLHPTSLDGNPVYGSLSASGNLSITSTYNGRMNADLSEVVPGDILRVYTGADTYSAFVVDSVLGDVVKVLHPEALLGSNKIEIWHTFTKAEQVEYIQEAAQSFANRRVCLVWPDTVGEGSLELPGYFLCAALAGLASGSLPHQGLTRVSVSGFDDFSRSAEYFNETQRNALAEAGVWIVTEDLDGTCYTRHALTTAVTDLLYSEEMITRTIDYISFTIRRLLEPYIGVTNVTEKTISSIDLRLRNYLYSISTQGFSDIGPMLTDYNIVDISQDDLLKDRINVTVSGTVPKATNYIVFRIQAS